MTSTVEVEPFGQLPDGRAVDRFVLRSGDVEAAVLSYGAILHTLCTPDRHGAPDDVLLGHDDLDGYLTDPDFHGATVGRYANRIAGARFVLDGEAHRLPANDGTSCLHGGPDGLHTQLWSATQVDTMHGSGVALDHLSPAGSSGFPGALRVTVTYVLTGRDLRIDYRAAADAPTVVNLTNHSYLDLSGRAWSGAGGHDLTVAAGHYVPVDGEGIPLGGTASVAGTPMDLRAAARVGERTGQDTVQLRNVGGLDHCWVLDRRPGDAPSSAAVLSDATSGRLLEVWTDQPGIQVYSGNQLDGSATGKAGRSHTRGAGICLETQHLPDSPNRPDFPSTVLRPGELFESSTTIRTGLL